MSIKTVSQQKLSANVYNKTKAGLNGSALFTASNSSYLSVGNQTALKLGSGDFTVETWLKRTTATSYMAICGDYNGTSGAFCWFFDTSSRISWYVAGSFILTSSTAISTNTWTHLAAVRNSGTLKFYINGTQDGSVSHANNYTNSNPFIIGQVPDLGTTAAFYNGYLSNFRVNSSALYTSSFTPTKRLTPISSTALLTVQSPTAIADNGPNGYTITNSGSVAASSDSPT